jgi:hypothetical protein
MVSTPPSGYNHQSTACVFTLPGFLDICKRDPFRVYLKFTFGGVRHHLLKGFDPQTLGSSPRLA